MINKIITKEEQSKLTPEMVLSDLMEGNKRYIKDDSHERDYNAQKTMAVTGQSPKAIVLSCVDSRVPVETVFDQGLGDVFVARVAGNFANSDIIGSMEFACGIAGSKLIFVLGHESCGAISAACDQVKFGTMTAMLDNIQPAIEAIGDIKGEQSSKNKDYVQSVVMKNVELTIDKIRKNSPVLEKLEDSGVIKIVGGVYYLKSGEIKLID
ncbi:MAG: carbonic anhydrase family protein [Psychroflexus sp.]|uniref:carbonic anhydrase family protein n=1 Tax=Psychroflexus sp. S27 TaxID=1982757 RepID=UPI000C2A5D48|nr:carbonic anhydrase family protein [Psychroflexus sp. S27]PJX22008.1 carbonic anhydrase [Psychroflexus sp. S27]